jgi:alkaline phosphatase
MQQKKNNPMGRRVFLSQGSLYLAGAVTLATPAVLSAFDSEQNESILRIALLTDVHYAEKQPRINRYYTESPEKLSQAISEFKKHEPNFIVELGDLIDAGNDIQEDKKNLKKINSIFASIGCEQYHALGNHSVELLTKEEFLGEVGQEHSFFSFDKEGWHFVMLDGCYRQDGIPYGRKNADWKDTKIPEHEIEWLANDLKITPFPSIVMLHQRLDLNNQEPHTVKNADQIRLILEKSERVKLVLQGHDHRGGYKEIEGIHYCTLSAMIEGSGEKNNSYSLLEIAANGNMKLTGFVRQKSRDWKTT